MIDYYIKNPVIVEAYQYFGNPFTLQTLEGEYLVTEGYWIATGVNGEKYPIRDDIFKKTYHRVGKSNMSDIEKTEEYINILEENNVNMWKEIERLKFRLVEMEKDNLVKMVRKNRGLD